MAKSRRKHHPPTPPTRGQLIGGITPYLRAFDPGALSRGLECYNAGRVIKVTKKDEGHSIEIRGATSVPYKVGLVYRDRHWLHHCSCPAAYHCEHAYAAGLALRVALLQEDASTEGQAEPLPLSPLERAITQCEKRLKRPLETEEVRFLAAVERLMETLPETGGMSSWHFKQLPLKLDDSPLADEVWATPMLMQGWWVSRPTEVLHLVSFIVLLCREYACPVPAFLDEVADPEAAKAASAAARESQQVRLWETRLAELTEPRDARPPKGQAPFPDAFRFRIEGGEAHWEVRESEDEPWHAPRLSHLREWLRAADLPAYSGVAGAQMLRAIRDRGLAYLRAQNSLLPTPKLEAASLKLRESSSAIFVRDLLLDEQTRAHVCGADGQPLSLLDNPARWSIARDPLGPELASAHVVCGDGTPLRSDATFLLTLDGAWVIDPPAIHRLPPPLGGRHSDPKAWSRQEIPARAFRKDEVCFALHRAGVQIEPDLLPAHESIRLTAQIETRIAPRPGGGKDLLLEASAIDAHGTVFGRWERGRWIVQPHRPDPQSPLLIPERTSLPDLAPILGALRVRHDWRASSGLVRNFSPQCVAEISAWADQARAAGVSVGGSAEIAGLLRDPVCARLKVELAPEAGTEDGRVDWFDLRIQWEVDDASFTPEEIALLLKANGRPVELGGKGWHRLKVEIDGADSLAAAGLDAAHLPVGGRTEMRLHALQIAQDKALSGLLAEKQAAELRRRARELTEVPAPPIPDELRAELRPYQAEGFHFLAFLSRNRLGGILADDMGLGKTVQALAWLLWLRAGGNAAAGGPLPAFRGLVVCPKSVTHNWEREAARFAPTLRVALLDAAGAVPAAEALPDVLVVNYTQLRLAADALTAVNWSAIILDEAQAVKNPASQTTQTARALRSPHRLALTGTPVENRLLDLWSIFSFALPGLLGSRAGFNRAYGDVSGARARLAQRVRPFLLRRTKAQVAPELPPRMEEDLACDLEGAQRALYDAELKRARAALKKIRTPKELDKHRFNVLQSLLRLRQICCDPRLVGAEGESAKLEALFDTIEPLIEEGHKVLVFSQFVTMLELIRPALDERGIKHWWLTGETEDRGTVVDAFQDAPEAGVFLLSLKAAGTGLNLTAASYVVLYDPWWNPAVEAQAIDRTHRIGQKNQVIAYRLLAANTVEEKIRALQRSKAALARDVVGENEIGSVMDLETLRFVLE